MRVVLLVLSLVVGLCVGCKPEPNANGGVGGAAGTAGFGGTGGTAGVAGVGGTAGMGGTGGVAGGACLTYETAPCMCGTSPGRMVCSVGVWSMCDCAGVAGTGGGSMTGGGEPLANKNANVMWTWTETAPSGGCKPGHYEGNFDGWYSSSLMVAGFLPVFALDATMPGLEFNLDQGAGGGEILTVSGGKMRGTANGLFPFEFDIVGELDCSTLKFNANLINGFYNAFGIIVPMEGPITADYDPVTASMVMGIWTVTEPTMPYGGSGNWSAQFTP